MSFCQMVAHKFRFASRASRTGVIQAGLPRTLRQNSTKKRTRGRSTPGSTAAIPLGSRRASTATSSRHACHSGGERFTSSDAVAAVTAVRGGGSDSPSFSVGNTHHAQCVLLRPCVLSSVRIRGHSFTCRLWMGTKYALNSRQHQVSKQFGNQTKLVHVSLPKKGLEPFVRHIGGPSVRSSGNSCWRLSRS